MTNTTQHLRKWTKIAKIARGHVNMAVKDSNTVAELQGLKK